MAAGGWALNKLPVIGKWLSVEVVLPRWAILSVFMGWTLFLILVERRSAAAAAAVPEKEPAAPTPQQESWKPEGLALEVVKALRTVDAGYLSGNEVRGMLRALALGDWPQADVNLALRELNQERFVSFHIDHMRGKVYTLADDGIRLAQRSGFMPKSAEALRMLRFQMNTFQD
ncbi:hypothetical protein [Stenotrophomonas sp. SAU14A_NAIMI4_8]|uniref:hypothetical protein n=1 Tax=Stenotrophomonas sp. SAU14A_NAIMI4_8 TaxID=2072409 RepID=UPI00131F0B96|nr:hypothetical protein [Stenotrophomonas sp. SAU14A_NAIMI4_8]